MSEKNVEVCHKVNVRCCKPWGRHVRGVCRNMPYRLRVRNLMPWGRHVRGLCWNVSWVVGEEFHAMGSSCERLMSKCAISSW